MERAWDPEQLISCWALDEADWQLLANKTAIESTAPPKYSRLPAGSKVDPFKEWICDQLRGDPSIPSLRLREMAVEHGYGGGKSIFDDYVRKVRPRFLRPRTFQRTIDRPGEPVQCDLWEPRRLIAVGHGQLRRGYVVTVGCAGRGWWRPR